MREVGFSTEIEANNSAAYVQRISESRALDDRIYRLRYVIQKFSQQSQETRENYTYKSPEQLMKREFLVVQMQLQIVTQK